MGIIERSRVQCNRKSGRTFRPRVADDHASVVRALITPGEREKADCEVSSSRCFRKACLRMPRGWIDDNLRLYKGEGHISVGNHVRDIVDTLLVT